MKTLTKVGIINVTACVTAAIIASPTGTVNGIANILNPVRGIASCFGEQPKGREKAAETLIRMAVHQAACTFVHEHSEWREAKGFWALETVMAVMQIHELYTAAKQTLDV